MAGGPHVMTPGAGGGSGEILGEQRREDSEYARKNKEFLKRMGLQLSSPQQYTDWQDKEYEKQNQEYAIDLQREKMLALLQEEPTILGMKKDQLDFFGKPLIDFPPAPNLHPEKVAQLDQTDYDRWRTAYDPEQYSYLDPGARQRLIDLMMERGGGG